MHWEIWASDYFDRESPPSLEASGEGLELGLSALWVKTLDEGFEADGRPTFTGFTLRGEPRAAIPRAPFENPGIAKLKQWRGEPGFLAVLVQAHLARLERGGAKALLAEAERARDFADFTARLG